MANERRRMGGRGQMPVEKAKDFKGSIGKLFAYMKQYHAAVVVVILCAIASTVFSVIGPDILGKATTELSNGLLAKIQGTGSIDFTKIGQILLFVLGLYLLSTLFSFVQGWLMTGVTQKVCYRMRKDISEKIDRMPMAYFESRTYGEVLSRITNDVDTLGQSLNQSITQLITSITTMIGVLIMMLSTIAAFRVFNEIYVLTNGSAGPGGMDMTMSMLIKREGTGIQARTGYASAISIVVLVIVGVMLIVQQIVQKRGED